MNRNRITFAVIVTYNREQYIKKLIDRLADIARLEGIFILNNAGTDGTDDVVMGKDAEVGVVHQLKKNGKDIYYYRNDKNLGGAGGFRKAFSMVMEYTWDYLWIMDDDVLPERDCLAKLIDAVNDEYKVCIPNRTDELYMDHATVKYDLSGPFKLRRKSRVKVVPCSNIREKTVRVYAMPFEGPLITRDIVEQVGFPDDSYFIIYDDSDYCIRCLKHTKAQMVMGAVLHKQIIPNPICDVGWKDYYAYRNCFAFDHKYCTNYLARNFRPWLIAHSLMIKTWITKDTLQYKIIKKAYRDYQNGNMGKIVTMNNFEEIFD